jgi:(p)ppGpp synthase/HD superfamily hydrolase
MIDKIDEAVRVATGAHEGQMYGEDEKYINHPLRVWHKTKTLYNEDVQAVAILHDVVEDSTISLDFIRAYFGVTVGEAIDAITRRKDQETYMEYIQRVKHNEIARVVKLFDLQDNMENLAHLPPNHPKQTLYTRYANAKRILEHP